MFFFFVESSPHEMSRGRADKEEDAAVIDAYMSMARAIEAMELEGVWDLKPMFNGGEVKKILPKIPRGPAFSDVMDVSHGISCMGAETAKDLAAHGCGRGRGGVWAVVWCAWAFAYSCLLFF